MEENDKCALFCNEKSETNFQQLEEISNYLVFYVNGSMIKDNNIEPEWTLIYYLRNKLGLTGTKQGCSEGGCGACTVMISRYDRDNNKIINLAVNACLMPVCAAHGMSVTTIEGIGSTKTKLHPIQDQIAKSHGSQCGFCTPGIVMSMYALLRSKSDLTMNDINIAFQGNLCRCTGYRPIIEGVRIFTNESQNNECGGNSAIKNPEELKGCPLGKTCCKMAFTSGSTEILSSEKFDSYNPLQEPIFPPDLQLSSNLDDQYLIVKGKQITWYRPTNLQQLLELKNRFPNAKLVVGNTEVGVEVKVKHFTYPVLIHPTRIKELKQVEEINDSIKIGASVTLNELKSELKRQINTKPESKTRIFESIVNLLHWFAGTQIRNTASIGGNIMTGSPISDLNPAFMAAGIKLNLCSVNTGYRTVQMDDNFFISYRSNIVRPDEVLTSIEIPYSVPNQYFVSYKQSKRREDDIAIVNMAMNVFMKPGTNIVENVSLTFGGMGPVTLLAKKTCKSLIQKNWTKNNIDNAIDTLSEELTLSENAPGGMVLYRRALTLSLFFKGYVRISKQLHMDISNVEPLSEELDSVRDYFHYKTPKSSQYYQMVPEDQPLIDLIGRPLIHASAFKQTSGEAIYCDDIQSITGELFMAFIMSTQAYARIIKIDKSKAMNLEGVVGYFDAKDIPNDRRFFGPIIKDDEIFASELVTCHGQIIAAIVAKNQAIAQKAARLVNVEYEELKPLILTIEDAIKMNSFYEKTHKRIEIGNVDKAFAESDHVLEGKIRIGGQEHFYLETQCTIAVPKEEDEMEIFSATQDPSATQSAVAHVLKIPANKITVRVKRLGGAFGGKETRSLIVTLPVALAAYRLKKPIRCTLDRDEDMMLTGTRHPFLFKYKVGFTSSGLINVLQIHIYVNGGNSLDLSEPVIFRAITHIENAYKIQTLRIFTFLCKTNLPSNTAFRGFGAPQAMFAIETIIHHIADYLERDIIQLSEINLCKEGDVTFFNQILVNCTIHRCWKECLEFSKYKERFESIQKYNKEHRYKKKGLSVIPTRFGIAFETQFLNQAGALVHVYKDGSVLLTHGGVEMGQGIHTKMIQVATRILKVNPNKIHITETSTDKVPNATATAGSTGSDLNGMAVMNACNEIMKRINYIIVGNPNGTWESWVETAYLDRVSLSATGFHRTPDIGYNLETNKGILFDYFTYGAACTEVEIDCLTGDHEVLRTDIVMDLGESLNPAIDIGQVEGAFTQGYGLFTMEEMIYSPTGILQSRGPGAYKIPGFANIPQEFNVSLLKGVSNPRAVYSSKAVGEPPLFLASSAFFAIKQAIKAARRDMDLHEYFQFNSPATAAAIRMACIDNLTTKIDIFDGKGSWNIVP